MDTPPIKETFGPLLASDGTWTRSTWLRVIVSCFTPPPPSLGKWEGWCGGSATPEPTLHQEGFHSWSRNPPPREPFSWKGCACEGKPDTLQAEEKGSSSLSLSLSLSLLARARTDAAWHLETQKKRRRKVWIWPFDILIPKGGRERVVEGIEDDALSPLHPA